MASILQGGLQIITCGRDRTSQQALAKEVGLEEFLRTANRDANESTIPGGKTNLNESARDVYLAVRVLSSDALKDATSVSSKAPNLFHQWGVIVGDYVHQLKQTSLSAGSNYYKSEKPGSEDGWTKFKVGATTFNDFGIYEAGCIAVAEMPETYNSINNNCQHFALRLVEKAVREGHVKKQAKTKYLPPPPTTLTGPTPMEAVSEAPKKPKAPIIIEIERYGPVAIFVDKFGPMEETASVGNEGDHWKLIEETALIMVKNTSLFGGN